MHNTNDTHESRNLIQARPKTRMLTCHVLRTPATPSQDFVELIITISSSICQEQFNNILNVFQKTPVTNISIPIAIKITPPKIDALFASFVPNFLPIITPAIQITKVTAAMSNAHTIACSQS